MACWNPLIAASSRVSAAAAALAALSSLRMDSCSRRSSLFLELTSKATCNQIRCRGKGCRGVDCRAAPAAGGGRRRGARHCRGTRCWGLTRPPTALTDSCSHLLQREWRSRPQRGPESCQHPSRRLCRPARAAGALVDSDDLSMRSTQMCTQGSPSGSAICRTSVARRWKARQRWDG